jgi:hypothetical protein
MSDKFLVARCRNIEARFGIKVTPEELKAYDEKLISLKDNPTAIAEIIGEPINNEKNYSAIAKSLLVQKTIGRGEVGEYPNPIERVADTKAYWLGRNANIESVRVEGAISNFECHILVTDNIQIGLEEYMGSKYDFIPEYKALIGEILDKREDYHALNLIKTAADSGLKELCVAGVKYADWKNLMATIDAYFVADRVLGTLANLQSLTEMNYEGDASKSDIPVFTPETREAALMNGYLGAIGGARVQIVRGSTNIAGVSTAIMPANRILLVGRPNEVGYMANRELPSGGARYVQTSPFMPSLDKQNPGVFMSMYGLEDLGMVVANSYKVAEFVLNNGS